MINLEVIGFTYLSITGIYLLSTGLWLAEYSMKGIDSFWDWVWYSVLWPKWALKSLWKMIKL